MGYGRFLATATATAALLAGALTSPALAQGPDPDVIVDPDSPSAKEYAIPLAQARTEVAGDAVEDRAVARVPAAATPLFGVGIAVSAPRADRTPAGRDTRHRARKRIRRRSGAAPAAPPAPAIPVPPRTNIRAVAAPPDGGIGETALLAGGGAAVLLLGTLLGLMLRHRPPRSEP